MANVVVSAFLDGFTGGSLFARLRRPGAPTQLFADEETDCPQSELVTSLLREETGKDDESVQYLPDLHIGVKDYGIDEEIAQSITFSDVLEPEERNSPLVFSVAGRKFRIVEEKVK